MSKAMSSDPITPSPRVEVITSVQRRRRWSTAEKVRLVEEYWPSNVCRILRSRRRLLLWTTPPEPASCRGRSRHGHGAFWRTSYENCFSSFAGR